MKDSSIHRHYFPKIGGRGRQGGSARDTARWNCERELDQGRSLSATWNASLRNTPPCHSSHASHPYHLILYTRSRDSSVALQYYLFLNTANRAPHDPNMSMNLATLPSDILTPILSLLTAHELGKLLFSGSRFIMARFYSQSLVTRFEYVPQRPDKAVWPTLVSRLTGLLTLAISMPRYYGHMPLEMKGDCSLPSSLTEVSLCYAQANDHLSTIFRSLPHLHHICLDGMRAPFSSVFQFGAECETFTLKSFSIHFEDWAFGERLTKIDMPLYLHAFDLTRLPATLTSISLLRLLGIHEIHPNPHLDKPEIDDHNDDDDQVVNSTANYPYLDCVFPPNLKLLHVHWRKASYWLFPKLPEGITELEVDELVAHGRINFPPNLRHLSIANYSNSSFPNSDVKEQYAELFSSMPTALLTLKLRHHAEAGALPESLRLPSSLTNLELQHLSLPASHLHHLPPSLKYLSCTSKGDIGTLHIPERLARIDVSRSTHQHQQQQPLHFELPSNSRLRAIYCMPHVLKLDINNTGGSQWPRTLTKLHTSVRQLDASFFSSLPQTLINLNILVETTLNILYRDDGDDNYDDDDEDGYMQRRARTNENVQTANEDIIHWPPALQHLRTIGIRGHKLFPLPNSLLSVQTERASNWDTHAVLSRLPDSLTKLCIPGLVIHDEDVPQLPSRIVSIDEARLKLTITGCVLLPRTLAQLGTFQQALSFEMEDAISEWCSIRAPRMW